MKAEKMACTVAGLKSYIIYIDYHRHNALASTIQMQKCIGNAPYTMHAVAKKQDKKKKKKVQVTEHHTINMGNARVNITQNARIEGINRSISDASNQTAKTNF